MSKTALTIVITAILASIAFGLEGSGTEEDPWRIRSLDDFHNFAGSSYFWWGHTRLETDVNIAGVYYDDAVIGPGDDSWGFSGVFDGNDHKVVGLTIDRAPYRAGLFGCVSGSITNLGLEDCSIGSYVEGSEAVTLTLAILPAGWRGRPRAR